MASIEQVLNHESTAPVVSNSTLSQTGSNNSNDLLSYTFPDSTNLVIERYNKYIQLIHSIQHFANGYSEIAASTIKQYDLLNKTVTTSMPNFESSNEDSGVSGSAKLTVSSTASDNIGINDGVASTVTDSSSPTDLNTFLHVMRQKLGDGYTRSMDFQTKVQSQILPDLTQLVTEVDKKQKEYASYSNAEQKDLSQLKSNSAKVSQSLDLAVQEFEHGVNGSKNRSDYKKDPYLVKKTLLRNAALQVKSENNRIEFLANGEASLRSSEARILLELRRIFNLLTQFIDENFGGVVQSFNILRETLNRVPEDFEWSHFLEKNSAYLITASSVMSANNEQLNSAMSNLSVNSNKTDTALIANNPYKRNLESITFRNYQHVSTKPSLEGVLERKESTLGLSSKYNSYYFVITPSGYFYGFPSKSIDSFQPNLVLYLPECETKIKNSSGKGEFTFILRGKNLCTLVPKPKKKYVFKASSAQDFDTWWKVITRDGAHTNHAEAGTIFSGSDISDNDSE